MIYATTKHDAELSKKIWPSFKPTLEEKHSNAGSMGKQGEDAAIKHLENSSHFPYIKAAISHEDCLHQLLGIDITVINHNGTGEFIDVKTGSSYLYWTRDEGWFITLRRDYIFNHKKTEAFLLLGPKKDVFVYFKRQDIAQFMEQKTPTQAEVKLYKRHWPSFIKTNL